MASGVDTHTHIHTYFGGMKVISRNQVRAGLRPACAWFNKFKKEKGQIVLVKRTQTSLNQKKMQFVFIKQRNTAPCMSNKIISCTYKAMFRIVQMYAHKNVNVLSVNVHM